MEDRDRLEHARQVVRQAAHDRMISLGLHQTELADKAGLSRKTISRFFNQDWREAPVIRAISVALGWEPDGLDRMVEQVMARDALADLEASSPGTLVLDLGEHTLDGLTPEEFRELRATLHAVALRTVGELRARTPGRGLATAASGPLAVVGA